MGEWISKLLQDTLSRTLAAFLSGFLVAALVFAFSSDFAGFLRSEVIANVGLMLILVLFSLIGLATGLSGLWTVLVRYRGAHAARPRDEHVEETQKLLLEKLAVVEAGPEIYTDHVMRDFRAELIARYDQWEGAVEPYIAESDKEQISEMRAHIQRQSLNHARGEATEWSQAVRDITYIARSNVRPPQ